MTVLRTQPQGPLQRKEAEEILDVALRIEARQSPDQPLTLDELKAIGFEIGLDPESLDRAAALVEERRLKRQQQRAQLRRGIAVAAAVGLVLAAINGGLVLASRSTLMDQRVQCELQQAQVQNMLQRQSHVEARFKDAAKSPERESELAGSENRVAIARRRYLEVASNYQRSAQGLFARQATTWFALPSRCEPSEGAAR